MPSDPQKMTQSRINRQPPNCKNLKHFLKLSIETFLPFSRTNSGTYLNLIADIILLLYEHEGMQISWTGHDGFRIKGTNSQSNQLTVYIDPYQLSSNYQNQNDADVVLITHDHFDHLSIDDLAQKAETIPWEILTRIGSRFERFYVNTQKTKEAA